MEVLREKQLQKKTWRLPGRGFGFRGLWFVDFFVDFLVVWDAFFVFLMKMRDLNYQTSMSVLQ